MNGSERTILKNASVMLVTQVFTWGLAFIATLVIPRFLGPNGLGQFHLAASLWAIIGIVAAFGMDAVMIREIARDPDQIGKLLFNAAILRAGLFFLGAIILLPYSLWAGYSPLTLQIILIIGFSQFIGLITNTCQSVFQGLEKMEYSSLSQAVERTIATGVSIGLLVLGYGVIAIAVVNVASSIIALSIQYGALRRIRTIRVEVDFKTMKWLLKTSVPFLLFSSFIVIYGQIDTVVLSLILNDESIGLYSVIDRLYGTFLFVPTIFISAVFPALSRMFSSDPDSLGRLARKSFELMILVAVPIGFGLSVIADPLVTLLFGSSFQKSGPILTVRAVVLIFTYLNMLFGMFLLSVNKQKQWAVAMGIATFLTIPLDFALIPWSERVFQNGAMGGAFSYMITESGMLIAAVFFLPRGILQRAQSWFTFRVILAGLLMGSAVFWIRETMIAIPILTGAVVYVLALILLRVLTRDDWVLLKSIAAGIAQRFSRRVVLSA
jgi:O-antigen/teichoic acid export membrane protein